MRERWGVRPGGLVAVGCEPRGVTCFSAPPASRALGRGDRLASLRGPGLASTSDCSVWPESLAPPRGFPWGLLKVCPAVPIAPPRGPFRCALPSGKSRRLHHRASDDTSLADRTPLFGGAPAYGCAETVSRHCYVQARSGWSAPVLGFGFVQRSQFCPSSWSQGQRHSRSPAPFAVPAAPGPQAGAHSVCWPRPGGVRAPSSPHVWRHCGVTGVRFSKDGPGPLGVAGPLV